MKYSGYITPKRKNKYKFKPSGRKYLRWLLHFIKFLFIGVVIFGLYYVVFDTRVFHIDMSKVEIHGVGDFVNYEDFKSLVQTNVEDKNILLLNKTDLENILRDNFLSIKEIEIQKRIPPFLVINVVERIPLFLIQSSATEDMYMIDNEGFVLGIVSEKYLELPLINYTGEILIGNFIAENIVSVYKNIDKGLEVAEVSASSISLGEKYSSFYLEGNLFVELSNDKSGENLFNVIKSLLGKNKNEEKKISKIDLRYDKVIVSYD